MTWLTAEQALILLGTKSQTLYANVSRGRIRAKPDPSDTRRSLYFGEDVNKLAARHPGRRKSEAVAEEAFAGAIRCCLLPYRLSPMGDFSTAVATLPGSQRVRRWKRSPACCGI
ncbi:hypothetical protein EV561_111134 [Rhizobium sp. BK376]|nr:hypothetical protein EV561_111134 [Rhizobium sp. BK376]